MRHVILFLGVWAGASVIAALGIAAVSIWRTP